MYCAAEAIFEKKSRTLSVHAAKPSTTVEKLKAMVEDGSLEEKYLWLTKRIQDYRIEVDEDGSLIHAGEPIARQKVVLMLKRDFQEKFPYFTNKTSSHIVEHGWNEMVRLTKEKFKNEGEEAL